jgi:hypothetical protein
MSWWISLRDEKNEIYCDVPKYEEGGTYVSGGSTIADINVTYNYGGLFGFGLLHGKKASETIPTLEEAVSRLGTVKDDNYWSPTEGNVGFACSILLSWAKQHPEGTWSVN